MQMAEGNIRVDMDFEEYYGSALSRLEAARKQIADMIENCPVSRGVADDDETKAVIYCKSRIKSPKSMMGKMERKGLATDSQTALANTHDAVGVRAVCAFTDDVYNVAKWVAAQPGISLTESKDYIAYPKPNGYRSYHMILALSDGPGAGQTVELQLRTIAIDFWATLEHQMKYKHSVSHEALVRDELKRCADEIASIDFSMQTIRDLLSEEF